MNETELSNAQDAIKMLTEQALTLFYRINNLADFVDKKGGLAGAEAKSINAYNALLQLSNTINNRPVSQEDYLAVLVQNIESPIG